MLVLDANILIRAILGKRVRQLLEKYAPQGARFYAPDAAFVDAEKYLPALLSKRGKPAEDLPAAITYLRSLVEALSNDTFAGYDTAARQRLRGRTKRTGRFWPPRSVSRVASGRKIQISSGLESLCGPPTEWNSSSVKRCAQSQCYAEPFGA